MERVFCQCVCEYVCFIERKIEVCVASGRDECWHFLNHMVHVVCVYTMHIIV